MKKSQKGITLIEVLASIVILSIIILSIIPMFIQSSRATTISKNITESTYLAETEMEEIIYLNTTSSSPSLDELSKQVRIKGYNSDPACTNCYGISKEGRFLLVQIENLSEDLGKVIIKVFKDSTKNELESQMEMILSWKK